jgi:hypothetical protein
VVDRPRLTRLSGNSDRVLSDGGETAVVRAARVSCTAALVSATP